MDENEVGGLTSPQEWKGRRGGRVKERSLSLNEEKVVVVTVGHNRLFNGSSGIVHPNCI
jgi:hypothetical protein